jgi:NAD(P)H dehydrogenase (quinone)
MKVLIIYYSRGGTTKKMAELIAEEIQKRNIEVKVLSVDLASSKDMLEYDGLIVGSPTYYGTMAAEIKKLIDDSVTFHGKLDGKVGAAFSSSANVAGGNETTVLSILQAMLIHGMVVQGDFKGDHYGPVALNKNDSRCQQHLRRLGQRFADLLKKLKS